MKRDAVRLILTAVISAALAGVVGFILGAFLLGFTKQQSHAAIPTKGSSDANSQIKQLLDENEQLQTQAQQLEKEVRKAWTAKQEVEGELEKIKQLENTQSGLDDPISAQNKEDDRFITCSDWEAWGFHGFCQIPPEGKVPRIVKFAVGKYCGINRPKIDQILGPYEMLVSVDVGRGGGSKQTTRIKGFVTEGLVDGQSWEGYMNADVDINWDDYFTHLRVTAEIAIIGTWTYPTAMGSQKTVFTAVPLSFIREGLTKAEFENLLK